ncbi:MAG: hypothetical protein ACOC9P_02315 [bacterium]
MHREGQATICPDDQELPGAEDAPTVWIRKRDLGNVSGFEYGGRRFSPPPSP